MSLISPKAVYWLKTLSKFVSVQLVVQIMGLAIGIVLVRNLDQKQYAYYTIAITMQTTMLLLADMGINVGVSAIGGKVWQDKYRFGQLINTAIQLRYYLGGISAIVVTPILIWMLITNGASIIYAILMTIGVMVGVNFQLTNQVLAVVPRFHSQINRIQHLELLSAVCRVALLAVAYLTFLNAAIAIAVSSIAIGIQRLVLGSWVTDNIDVQAPINKKDKNFILLQVRDLAPSGLFFCLQGQIGVWLISIFGNIENVAEAGALGRIAIIFTLLNSIMGSIIVPSFARCQSVNMLRSRYFQVLGIYLTIGLALIIITALFPGELLWILGKNYSHLKYELLLMVIGTVLSSLVGAMSSLNLAKAWIQYVWIEIPLRIIIQIILLVSLDISTVKGVLIFGIFSNISPFLVNAFLAYRGLTTFERFSKV